MTSTCSASGGGSSFSLNTPTTVGTADADEDQGRDDRPADLGLDVAVDLLRHVVVVVVVTGPELEGDVEAPGEDDDEDDPGDREHRDDQVVDVAGLRALGLERVLRRVRRTAGQRQGQQRDEDEGPAEPAAQHRPSVTHALRRGKVRSGHRRWTAIADGAVRSAGRGRRCSLLVALLLVVLLDRAGPRGGGDHAAGQHREAAHDEEAGDEVAVEVGAGGDEPADQQDDRRDQPEDDVAAALGDGDEDARDRRGRTRRSPRRPRIGISIGYISRLRIARLTAGSPVARSDQARMAHSKVAAARSPRPRKTICDADDDAERDDARRRRRR